MSAATAYREVTQTDPNTCAYCNGYGRVYRVEMTEDFNGRVLSQSRTGLRCPRCKGYGDGGSRKAMRECSNGQSQS